MLRGMISQVKGWLGIEDDVVAMGLTILALGALAQLVGAVGKVISLDVDV